MDIKCRSAGLRPSAVVIVATVRALKMHGGVPKDALDSENLPALARGIPNLLRHVSNIREVFGLPCVVAVNRFLRDSEAELALVETQCRAMGVRAVVSDVWASGGDGAMDLAREVVRLCEDPAGRGAFRYCYEDSAPLDDKLNAIVRKIYHGKGFQYTAEAQKQKKQLEAAGFADLPVCVAKTQYSFSDDAAKLGAPEDFEITVRSLRLSAGAGFIVALTGSVMTMPGLPKSPAAERIDIDENGNISGLF